MIHTHRQTDRQRDRHFLKTTFLDSGDPKMDISTENSRSNFFAITILSLYYSICEKVKMNWGFVNFVKPHMKYTKIYYFKIKVYAYFLIASGLKHHQS